MTHSSVPADTIICQAETLEIYRGFIVKRFRRVLELFQPCGVEGICGHLDY